MKKMLITITSVILLYFIFFFDFCIKYTTENTEYTVTYNGLFWVGLDRFSIWYYNSDDKPMKWLDWDKI